MNSPRSTAHPSVSGEPFARSWPWWRRWWYAAKPGSWPKLLVPMLLGQALGAREVATPSVAALLGGGVMTIALLCFIVFANDAGDVEVDRIKRRMFPQGCSPKTVPDGVLTRRALVLGGAATYGVTVCVTKAMGLRYMVQQLADLFLNTVLAPGLAAAAMFLCARGLLRLKSWALLATVAMNWVVMLGCLHEVIDAGFGALLLAFTSIIQLFLPVPVLAAMIRGKVVPRPRLERLMPRLLRGTLMAATLWLVFDVVRAAL